MHKPVVLVVAVTLAACSPGPEGLRRTPDGTGPLVVVDWNAEPLPDLPFPNDLATRPDPTSPTGLRPNLSLNAHVEIEQQTRAAINGLSGFGTFAPITVSFEGALDIGRLLTLQDADWVDSEAFHDDAVLLIDVTKGSPDYREPVRLEFDAGRFPQDATQLGNFLPNDPRASEPSLLFETVDEDTNGNGLLDAGEDTDGDGRLDRPNVWPPGGDPRADLLTSYDLQSNTLFLRPVVPLREETTYAVVLTSSLVDADGAAIRSPWPYVNHTRQTDTLEPAVQALDDLGRGLDDIAFAWSFTTGAITTELWEVAEGLRGRGVFAQMADDFPAGVTEAHHLHTDTSAADPLVLPVELLIGPLTQIGLIPATSEDFLADAYGAFTDRIVGGAFRSVDLLTDRDDHGLDDSDEHWVLDRETGHVEAVERRIAFTCALPKAGDGIEPPWPIVIHAHGYGSTRVEFIAFAYAMNRVGLAVCGLDAVGQGIALGPDEEALVAGLLQLTSTEPLWWHLLDDRVRDLNNDGVLDPAGDQFPADPFHARDMLRQPVVDWVQLIRSLQACGTGEMERMIPTATGSVATGEKLVTCDWDNDGAADLGGPDTEFLLHGVSQGGIMSSLSIAVQEASTAVVTVPGGGLADVAGRTDIGGVADGLLGRALSPLFLGLPQSDGTLTVVQLVISVDQQVELPVGTLPSIPEGGRVVVRNLDLDEEDGAPIPADGRFRVPIPANALDAGEKRLAAGVPVGGPGVGETYAIPDNAGLGDVLELIVLDRFDNEVARFDTWGESVVHEGITMEAGSPLIAASWGLGLRRGSRELQRLVGVLGLAVEAGDPILFARRWADDPFAEPKNVLVHLTVGDTTVPIATGIALARAAGLIDPGQLDERYGTSVDRWLIDKGVVHGMEELGPWRDPYGAPVLFDPDDLDAGTDGSGAPSEAPLRAERRVGDALLGLRFLYVDPQGSHAYLVPDESLAFDWNLFGAQQMAWFLATRGAEISDDPCLATRDCPFLRPFPPEPPP